MIQLPSRTMLFPYTTLFRSSGKFEGGEGEQEDVTAAIDWMKKHHPGRKLIVGGFSFGSWVASRVACERPDVDAIFLIGTPVKDRKSTRLNSSHPSISYAVFC